MKTVLKFLRHTCIDVLFLGLIEKLALGLIKKLTAVAQFTRNFLDRVQSSRDESFILTDSLDNGYDSTIA